MSRRPRGGRRPPPSQLVGLTEREIFGGLTRSGARYTARNQPHYSSLRELLSHHQQLLVAQPVVTTRWASVGSREGALLQTTIRFRQDHPNIRAELRSIFLDLLRQAGSTSRDGFEVITTFNAILSNHESTTFSIFYGHDYRQGSMTGAYDNLSHGDPILVTSLDDVDRIPTTFDFDAMARRQRASFENSGVRVVRFINIVYLVYQFRLQAEPVRHRQPPPPLTGGVSTSTAAV
jgi:hypothetical protein